LKEKLGVIAGSEAGVDIMRNLDAEPGKEPAERMPEIETMVRERTSSRQHLMHRTSEAIRSMDKFQRFIADCLNCYNCREACPVCYCNHCVLCTDVFDHPPEVLMRRAEKRGGLKLPTDTTMFHLTRLTHMAHACIGCGQCSSVCPSRIPVADLFRTVGSKVQSLYGYEPGRSLEDPIPICVFEDAAETDRKHDAPVYKEREAV
jgi:formate dehydrogenase subunit beta